MEKNDLHALLRQLLDYEEHLARSGKTPPAGFDALMMQIDAELNAGDGSATPPPINNNLFDAMPTSVGGDGVFDPFGFA